MKKLLLILGLALLLAATAVSAQWTPIFQCYTSSPTLNLYDYKYHNCQGAWADNTEPILGHLISSAIPLQNTIKITRCEPLAQGASPFLVTGDTCPQGGFGTAYVRAGFFGQALASPIAGKTQEVFRCRKTATLANMPVYLASKSSNCRSGYTRDASLGHWAISTDVPQPPAVPVCGNNNLEAGEQCEPPNTPTCNSVCQTITPPAPAEPQVCCLVTQTREGRTQREAGVQTESKCNEYATKEGFTVEKLPSAKCEEEVCCESDGRRDKVKFRKCYQRNGVIANVPLDQCKGEMPSVCGNGKVEAGEQCEPPATATCDAQCRTIAPPPAVCPVTQAENDALLATLSALENERDGLVKKEVCCGTEQTKPGKPAKRDAKVMTLGECNNRAREAKIFGLYKPDKCEAKVCCEMPSRPAMMSVFRECIREGQEVSAEKCAAPPAPVCGNGIKETGEACETEKDCGTGMLCSNCQCAKISVALPPTGTPLTDDQVWHVYQCIGSVYIKNQNVGPYATTMMGPPGCGSFAATMDHDLGYILKQFRTGIGIIRYCQHQSGTYLDGVTTETDIKFNANCDYDDRQLATTQTIGPNAVTPSIMGYAFTTQQPGTKPMYKCVKSGTPLRYNFKVSSSANCNAGQSGWDGYSNAGTLGYWLTQPLLPTGIQ